MQSLLDGARRGRVAASACASLAVLGALVVAGCGGGGGKSHAAANAPVKPPGAIAGAGQIAFCSDVTYPPEEFYKGSTPVGSDVQIGQAIAKQMGVKAVFDNTGFDGIIPALQSKKCDAIISAMNDTAQRRAQVNFVDYIRTGQSIMVPKGNPKGIHTLADLSGRTVSVETGTTNKQFLDQESKTLKAQGRKPIHVVTFPKDTDAASALKTGKVDAYFGDSPPVAYYVRQDPSSFAFAGSPINPIPIGIALRKDEQGLRTAVQQAVNRLYANGTMHRILGTWRLSAAALKA
jgi:polar amino acid transport system substrate-binding protein